MKRASFSLSLLSALLVARVASAYRPFDATDASVAERGELELEIGPATYIHAHHTGYAAPLQVLNLGIWDRWELVLQGQELPADRAARSGARVRLVETEALLKTVLLEGVLQGRRGLSVAAEAGALLPTVNDEPGAGVSAAVIASERWGFGTFHLNVEGRRTRAANAQGVVSLIAEGPITWPVRPVTEVFVEDEIHGAETYSVLVGLIAKLDEKLSLDFGTRLASVSGAEVYEARAGFTWAIPVWK